MYASFYGLDTLAFQLTPDPRFFFESTEHRRALAHLTYGLHHAEGFIIITGEVGAGKTMLVDHLLSQIDPRSFVTAKIVTSQLGGDDMLRMVASAFGVDHTGLPKATLLTRIQDFVVAQLAAQRRALLIIDEAQNLSFEALEELRMLSNIVVGTTTALQSFLLGQPQFRVILGNPALDQLRQRVTAAYHLGRSMRPIHVAISSTGCAAQAGRAIRNLLMIALRRYIGVPAAYRDGSTACVRDFCYLAFLKAATPSRPPTRSK